MTSCHTQNAFALTPDFETTHSPKAYFASLEHRSCHCLYPGEGVYLAQLSTVFNINGGLRDYLGKSYSNFVLILEKKNEKLKT